MVEKSGASDNYDAVVNRPEGAKTSDFSALIHLLKCATATGILFLPNGYRRTGYVASVTSGIVIGFIYCLTSVALVKSAQQLCKRHRIPMLDLAGVVETSFSSGPVRTQNWGKCVAVLTNFMICYIHYQTAVIYILYFASSMGQIIEHFTDTALDIRLYIVFFLPFFCLIALVPDLEYLAPVSALGTLCFLFGICSALYYFLIDIPDSSKITPFTSIVATPMYCSLFLYALHNITIYMPLENSMKKPSHLPALIVFSVLFTTTIYVVFGFFGYKRYPMACDTIIKNLPLDETLAQVVKIAISFSVLLSCGLVYFIPTHVLWPLIQKRYNVEDSKKTYFRLFGVVLTTFIAIAVPEMVPLIGFFSSISMSVLMMLIPIWVETNTKWQEIGVIIVAKNFIIFLVFLLILIFGAYESLMSIVREYGGGREKGC